MPSDTTLPVLIAGAGPCGLVVALVLQRQGVPFLIIEKASSRIKLCSNVGSGFDLAPTAIDILRNRLHLPVDDIFCPYAGMYMATMEDMMLVRDVNVHDMGMGSVNRADLQNMLLDALATDGEHQEEAGYLKCGVAVKSYEEDAAKGVVTVTLSDGSKVKGRALLGSDGIHSEVRACLHAEMDDPLRFCGTNSFWGKCDSQGPGLQELLKETQTFREVGMSFMWLLGTPNSPGTFFIIPMKDQIIWCFFEPAEQPPGNASDDLTRRGGCVMTQHSKSQLLDSVEKRPHFSALAQKVIEATPAEMITEAGIFDRQRLDLPFSSPAKLVALLGDSAHPQSPFSGQGANMAITDAYVCGLRLSQQTVPAAIAAYDSNERREGARKMVGVARDRTSGGVSSSWFTCWLMRVIMKYMPASWMTSEVDGMDETNRLLVQRLDEANSW